jgi:membrane-associated phospholipid phosphatase
MVEVYAQAVARDVPFTDYSTNPLISHLLGDTYLNDPRVLQHLPDRPSGDFTPQTVFRGPSEGCLVGPYISQALLLDVPTSQKTSFAQRYTTLKPRYEGQVEWGTNASETIHIQNGVLDSPAPSYDSPKYIYCGRNLAEAVHFDVPYQYYYQAALIFQSLGVPTNPTFPTALNANAFVTGDGVSNIMSCLAQISNLALKHAWYQKWSRWRRLRPEVYGLWVDNVKNDRVKNTGAYDLDDIILTSPILNDVRDVNAGWGSESSYTLPLCFREGSPCHPSYPAGHATTAGACATILKIFFDGDRKWSEFNSPVQADATGENLMAYEGADSEEMTVGGEIDKLAYNITLGRDWAGVHYRTDGSKGIELGEQVAMHFFSDVLSSCIENAPHGHPPPSKSANLTEKKSSSARVCVGKRNPAENVEEVETRRQRLKRSRRNSFNAF